MIVGHDWGAPVAWHAALIRPDRFRAVAALSVPYTPRGRTPPTRALAAAVGDHFMYMLYFQTPGVAEAELEADVRASLRRLLYSGSGDAAPDEGWRPVLPANSRLLDGTTDPRDAARRGSPRPISTSTPGSSSAPGSGAASAGTGTWTARGS